MFGFSSSHPGSLRHFWKRPLCKTGVFALLLLPAMFFVMGCDTNGASGEAWVTGSWSRLDSTFEATNLDPGNGDTFAFDTAARTFERGGFGPWDGAIPGILLFDTDGNAGLVFVRFGEERPNNFPPPDWAPVPVEGNYTAIAFRVATGGFQLAELADENWEMPTTDTLQEARNRFTVDTVDGYVRWSYVPVYARIE